MDAIIDTRRGLAERAAELKRNRAQFRPLPRSRRSTPPTPTISPAIRPKCSRRCCARPIRGSASARARSHVVFDFAAGAARPARAARDLLGRHAVHRRFRAGGDPRQGRRHPVHVAPGAAPRSGIAPRCSTTRRPVSVNESLLIVHIEPLADAEQRAGDARRDRRHADRGLPRHPRLADRCSSGCAASVEDWKLNPPRARRPADPGEPRSSSPGSPSTISPSSACANTGSTAKAPTPSSCRSSPPGIGLLEDKDFHFLRAGTDLRRDDRRST